MSELMGIFWGLSWVCTAFTLVAIVLFEFAVGADEEKVRKFFERLDPEKAEDLCRLFGLASVMQDRVRMLLALGLIPVLNVFAYLALPFIAHPPDDPRL